MDKLGKVLVPTSKPTLETDGTLTGDGVNAPLGLNYTAWKFNTDELLWSGGPQSSIRVNMPLNLYERVMFKLGHSGYGKQFEEYSTNNTEFFLNPLFAKDSANSEVWFETNEWKYGDTKRDLVWQGHCYRRNLKANGGVFEDLSADVTGYDAEKYPISEVWGINRIDFNTFNVYLYYSEGGTLTSDKSSGYNGEICTLISTPDSEDWKCSAIDITGATLTGNDFMFSDSNVTASAGFEHSRELTLVPNEHATLSADKMTGFSGDVVTVDTASIDEGWYFTGLNVTGATATGNKFTFIGNDVTAEGLYNDVGYPITYLSDSHVHLAGDQYYIPGSEGISLQSSYDTYYRISGYDITGGSLVNGKLVATGPCTIKAVEKVNQFTASGKFNLVSNGAYAHGKGASAYTVSYAYFTGGSNVPAAYYNKTLTSYDGPKQSACNSSWYPTGSISGYKFSGITVVTLTSTYTGNNYRVSLRNSANQIIGNEYNKNDVRGVTVTSTGTTTTLGQVYRSAFFWKWTTTASVNHIQSVGSNLWTATGIAP